MQMFENEDFHVLLFPCDQFINQEPWDDEKIEKWVKKKFPEHLTNWTLMQKSDVNGKYAAEAFQFLRYNSRWFRSSVISSRRHAPWRGISPSFW